MAKIVLKENSRKVWDFIVAHPGEDFTATDIASATGLEIRSVNGILTSAFQRKGLIEREEAQTLDPATNKYVNVKYIRLTEAGSEFDPDAPDEDENEE